MKRQHAVVLGGGMIGSAAAMDLARSPGFEVTLIDAQAAALERAQARFGLRTRREDLGNPEAIKRAVADADIVIGALPSALGFQTLRAVIEAGKNYCDISFMSEDSRELDELARQRGVVAVTDCGVAPGVSNLLAGHAAAKLQPCEKLEIYVGGLPLERRWPFEYKAGFAPHDVIEEYTRPARIVERGEIVVREALSEPELIDFPGVGTLEVFNTDGLRSLAYTLKIPSMKEKTMRFPGHIELMRVLRHMGLFSKEPIEVKGQKVVPLDMTAALLFPLWTFAPGERDVTVMRVRAEGLLDGQRTALCWDLLDLHDPAADLRSMSRSTAFAATSMAVLMARGVFTRPGVHPPELVVREPGLYEAFLAEYAQRGLTLQFTSQPIS